MGFHSQANTFVDMVRLKVSQLERSLVFYKEVLGFQCYRKSPREAVLTANGTTPLVKLEQLDQPMPRGMQRPGLYHFALLVPTRADLGAFLQHSLEEKIRLGASDHIVSEALYLADPDGNGIEVYADRPASAWQLESGKIRMATDPLNTESLLAAAEEKWKGLPPATRMGHIHLQVTNLEKVQQFYCDGLGFDVVYEYPQALFMSTGGYHHHIAVNTWNDASKEDTPNENEVGLQSFSVRFPSDEARNNAVERLRNLRFVVHENEHNYVTEDPSGNQIQLNR